MARHADKAKQDWAKKASKYGWDRQAVTAKQAGAQVDMSRQARRQGEAARMMEVDAGKYAGP
jgi:hypothetical protein